MDQHCQYQWTHGRLVGLLVFIAIISGFEAASGPSVQNGTQNPTVLPLKFRGAPALVPNRQIGSIFDSVSDVFGNAMRNTRAPSFRSAQNYSTVLGRYAQPSSIFTFPQGKFPH